MNETDLLLLSSMESIKDLPIAVVICAAMTLAVVRIAEAGVIINEIHYDAEPKTEFVEYIELFNTSSNAVDLSNWSFVNGISFTFPAGTVLRENQFIVLAEDPTQLTHKFLSIPQKIKVFKYKGSLSNDGEKVELVDDSRAVADVVSYKAEFPWPISPNGEGNSMQLVNGTLDNDLGGAWRGASPTPGQPNSVSVANSAPIIRQVSHNPVQPTSSEACTITAKITDSDGVGSVTLAYQIVAPGAFLPAYLPHSFRNLIRDPDASLKPNPEFENPSNWMTVEMVDDGTSEDTVAADGIYTVQLPVQQHRTLVRYRINAEDSHGKDLRVPYPDDPSLNFAYFVSDGVPDYIAEEATFKSAMLTSLPVYTMITRDEDRRFAYAYRSTGDGHLQLPYRHASRRSYNWECALVYDGIVYDHIGWRLRQDHDRYAGDGKRSMRFRMNRGHYFQARGEDGRKLSVKWRRFSTSKMSRFGDRNTYGLQESINSKLWRMVEVECPYFLPAHFRMIDGAEEAPDPYNGDFFGLATIVQEIDGRLLDERGLPNGNVYKLRGGVHRPQEMQRNQSRTAVTDGSDFNNIRLNLNASQSSAWLNNHVDWNQWGRYHTVAEAVRHYDFGITSGHFKNRAWYFGEKVGTPYGLLRIVPHDHDASWDEGYHDDLNPTGKGIGTDIPWSAIFGTNRRPPQGNEKPTFTRDYRNFVRHFRQLLWQEETVEAIIDSHTVKLEEFALADRARWTGGPPEAGTEKMDAVSNVASKMKRIALTSDIVYGSELIGGRGAFLDQIAADEAIPAKPKITYKGTEGFPVGGLRIASSDFSDPQGEGTFQCMQWRIAEVATPVSILESGATWRYLDNGSDQGIGWRMPEFNDTGWKSGPTPAGYGEIANTPLKTIVNYGDDPKSKHITTYFRTTVSVRDVSASERVRISMNIDDAAVVYLNGEEVIRDGFKDGKVIGYDTLADDYGNEDAYDTVDIPTSHLVEGKNVIAVEVHQVDPTSSDVGFDVRVSVLPAKYGEIFEWNASWESGELADFERTIQPPAAATRAERVYRARVRHQDTSGRWSLWSDPLQFVAAKADVSHFSTSLVVSEIMYHPSDPNSAEIAAGFDDDDFFEYLEICNVGSSRVDLSGVRFTKGVDFDFSGSIAPGECVLVVSNRAAFEMRYGKDLPVVGTWSGKLNNGGERVKLSFGAGEPIQDFRFDDGAPWPPQCDGSGFSLTLIDPPSLPDHSNPISWRASTAAHGTPGSFGADRRHQGK